MRILLFGSEGQVGQALKEKLKGEDGVELTALSWKDEEPCGDLTKPEGIKKTIQDLKPDVIINAGAYTDVDGAETDAGYDVAVAVNAVAPEAMAEAAKENDALLVHYSTDFVYGGNEDYGDQPWSEDDDAVPANQYGATKLAGDRAIMRSGCAHIIFRTSWVYSADPNRKNFVRSILRNALTSDKLDVVDDQIGAATSAMLLADVTAQVLKMVKHDHDIRELFHVAPTGFVSRYDLAGHILQHAQAAGLKVSPKQLRRIQSGMLRTLAKRPFNSRLNCNKLQKRFGIVLPTWRADMQSMYEKIFAPYKAQAMKQETKSAPDHRFTDADQP